MTTTLDQMVSVLAGPTCPTCELDDLRLGAPLGAPRDGRCRDCGTEYHWYTASEPTCPGCGLPHDEDETGSSFCEDCGPSDCAYCGATTLRWMLSENLACRLCESNEAA